jgi:hypothetical protein
MWWIWAVFTAVFIVVEFIRKGSFILWLGFSSAVSCILSFLEASPAGQIAVFFNLSGILILLERRFNERYRFKTHQEMGELKEIGIKRKGDPNIFRRTGPVWEVVFNGDSFYHQASIACSYKKPFDQAESMISALILKISLQGSMVQERLCIAVCLTNNSP